MDELGTLLSKQGAQDALREVSKVFRKDLHDLIKGFCQLQDEVPGLGAALAQAAASKDVEQPDRTYLRIACQFFRHSYQPIIERELFDKLNRPRICTLEELTNAIETELLMENSISFEDRIEHLRRNLSHTTGFTRCSDPFPVAVGPFRLSSDAELWRGHSEFSILIVGTLPVAAGDAYPGGDISCRHHSVYAVAAGRCSALALAHVKDEAAAALHSAFVTIEHSCQLEYPGPWIDLAPDGLSSEFSLLRIYLDAYYANPAKKDSIDRRIRNAIHLLVESDRQKHHALGLALSMAALEALVGRKGEELANLIADNTAVMLEPEPAFRADAVEFAKRLYDARSQVLHGSSIEGQYDRRQEARALAAAMLKAMIERRDTLRRTGLNPEAPEDLLGEVKRSKFSAGLPTGVCESEVRRYWRRGAVPVLPEQSSQ